MIRTQISLREEQYADLQARARARGVSMSALIRDAVDQQRRDSEAEVEDAVAILGAFEADVTDLSVHHDRYLADSVQRR